MGHREDVLSRGMDLTPRERYESHERGRAGRGLGAYIDDTLLPMYLGQAVGSLAGDRMPTLGRPGGGSGLAAAGLAVPLLAAPANFVFGEGEGSYAQTQDFTHQLKSLARYKGGPLGVSDLNESAFKRLAEVPDVSEALIQSGTLGGDAIDELTYWQGRLRESEEESNLRKLGVLD